MATQKQIDAARRNGARSRGPVTPEGRARSSRNSLKHGITAKTFFILANESEEAFDKVVDGFFRHFQPANDVEQELCVSIAHAHWRIRRLAIVETGLLDREMLRRNDGADNVDEGIRLADAFETLASGNGALRLVTQYETRLYRTFHRLIDRLEKLRKDRNESGADIPVRKSGTDIPVCENQKNEPEPTPNSPAASSETKTKNESGALPDHAPSTTGAEPIPATHNRNLIEICFLPAHDSVRAYEDKNSAGNLCARIGIPPECAI